MFFHNNHFSTAFFENKTSYQGRDMAKIAIKDFARMLNTSTATVSRALNNHPAIKIEAKDKVLKMVDEVGYCPNTIAKNFIMQRSNTIEIMEVNLIVRDSA